MKVMPQKRSGPKVDPNVLSGNNGVTTTKEPIDPNEVQQHMEKLRNISAVAAKLFVFLGEHINFVSSVAPVERGRETLNELSNKAKAHRDGLATAFDPLREQIESLKNHFWEKNREVIETSAQKHLVQKVKERVAVEVEKAVKRYRDQVENNERNTEELRAVMEISRTRAENSLLRSNHLDEKVAWIGGEDSAMSFRDLVFASEHNLPSLATFLNIPLSEGDSKVPLLNGIFRKVGINYRVIPSRTSLLLIPTMTNL